MLEDLIARDTGYAEAKELALAMLARGWDLGTGGRIDVSRDEIHER